MVYPSAARSVSLESAESTPPLSAPPPRVRGDRAARALRSLRRAAPTRGLLNARLPGDPPLLPGVPGVTGTVDGEWTRAMVYRPAASPAALPRLNFSVTFNFSVAARGTPSGMVMTDLLLLFDETEGSRPGEKARHLRGCPDDGGAGGGDVRAGEPPRGLLPRINFSAAAGANAGAIAPVLVSLNAKLDCASAVCTSGRLRNLR